jgi:anthranilate synthase component II|tara:strand:- start:422 stop:1000 length:579 start_codon:yes stop_codon:yes gene_type:complete
MRLLLIDNFDSFTYNLVQYFGELGAEQEIFRNDAITPEQAIERKPDAVVISPGPCDPNQAGQSLAIIEAFAGKKPIFGVCLGHQCLGQYFGGKVIRAERLMHGKTSPVLHDEKEIFANLPNPFEATRYHSLIIEPDSMPNCLEVTAKTEEGEIMGIRHKELPVWGVQFHPESLATEQGILILKNFMELCIEM